MAMEKRDTAKCYRKNQGADPHEDDSFTPCNTSLDPNIDGNQCCGKNDQCMPVINGAHLCFSPNNTTDQMSYYVAGCTDSSYKSGSCFDHCEHEAYGAVKWQSSSQISGWGCCSQNGLGKVDCNQPMTETFPGPSQDTLDAWRRAQTDGSHVVRLAVGVIVAIVIASVVALAGCCILTWCCCFSRKAREKRSRGKFMPLGKTRGTEDVWDANVHNGNNTDLHEGPVGSYGYGGQGAPYNPPHQQGPQYTVANFR